ncbi:hypothetical protein [Brumimicrobium mesophilum]|uniref:hypothetical protein n=1 Tax=Brumimicrobium mesophilum TaxID=392717 RepID=UPI000D141E9A|nr:hypothetical protein [Brumimicrobium mesophilum]
METISIILGTIILSLAIGITGFSLLKRGHKKQKDAYPKLWDKFQKLKNENSNVQSKEIIEIANQLIYNNAIPTKHLEIILEFAKEMEIRYPEFKALKLNAYDKWVHRSQGRGGNF